MLEAGEKASFESVSDYLAVIDSSLKVDDDEYKRRLSLCKDCNNLISGMCLKCGCYVEIRAALKNKNCPNADNSKW